MAESRSHGASRRTDRNQLAVLDRRCHAFPWAGGGYFRLIPYPVFKLGVKRMLSSGKPYFYIHPWELDAAQPRLSSLKRIERLRLYLNREDRIPVDRALAGLFRWLTIAELLSYYEEGMGSDADAGGASRRQAVGGSVGDA